MDRDFDCDWGEHWCPVCNASYMVERYASYSQYERIVSEWGSFEDYSENHEIQEGTDLQLARAVAQTLPLWPGDRVLFYGWLDEDEGEDNQEEWNKALKQTLHLFDIPELYPDPDDEGNVAFLICPSCGNIMYDDD